jgi:hypothetical protein
MKVKRRTKTRRMPHEVVLEAEQVLIGGFDLLSQVPKVPKHLKAWAYVKLQALKALAGRCLGLW